MKTSGSSAASGSKERQSWLDMVNGSPAVEDAGLSQTFAVQVHLLAPSEANSCKAPENSFVTAESGLLNSLSSDDTSSLSSSQDHLTVPDKPTGSRMMDGGILRIYLCFLRKWVSVCVFRLLR